MPAKSPVPITAPSDRETDKEPARFGRSGESFGLSAEAGPHRDQDDRDALKKRRIIADLRQAETTRVAETAGHGEGGVNEIESNQHLFFATRIGSKDSGRRKCVEQVNP